MSHVVPLSSAAAAFCRRFLRVSAIVLSVAASPGRRIYGCVDNQGATQGPMNFIPPTGCVVGGGCAAGSASKALVTLDKFLCPGTVPRGKQPGVTQPCCAKRQRTSCAAATRAKRSRTRSTQLHIAEYFSLSSSSNSSRSSTCEKQFQQGAACTNDQFCGTASGASFPQSHVLKNATTQSFSEQRCNSSLCLEGMQVQDVDSKRLEANRHKACNSIRGAVPAAQPRFEGIGGSRQEANDVARAPAAGGSRLENKGESSSDVTREEGTAPAEHAREGTVPKSNRVSEEVPLRCGAEGAPSSRNALDGSWETSLLPIEFTTASAALSTVTVHAPAATPSSPESATPRLAASDTTLTGNNAVAAVSTACLATKKTRVAVRERSEASFLRCVTTRVGAPPVHAVDPGGQYLADLAQLELRWRAALGDSWFEELRDEIKLPYFAECLLFVRKEREKYRIFPPAQLMFNAFKCTPLDRVKVVIVGQDPYHQIGQAMGLAFSVPKGIPVPPSLQNIFKEIDRNYPARVRLDNTGKPLKAHHGDLTDWAKQGVFLMNTILTVRENSPLSHKHAGWERFTNKVVNIINTRCDGIVFLLWAGRRPDVLQTPTFPHACTSDAWKPAQKKSLTLDRKRHLILEAGHPSPLSVRFFEGAFPASRMLESS